MPAATPGGDDGGQVGQAPTEERLVVIGDDVRDVDVVLVVDADDRTLGAGLADAH